MMITFFCPQNLSKSAFLKVSGVNLYTTFSVRVKSVAHMKNQVVNSVTARAQSL